MTSAEILDLVRTYADRHASALYYGSKDGYTFPGSVGQAEKLHKEAADLLIRIEHALSTRQQIIEEIDSISGQGALGRKCSYCEGPMIHYRLRGYQCANPSCPGRDRQTGMASASQCNAEPSVRLG